MTIPAGQTIKIYSRDRRWHWLVSSADDPGAIAHYGSHPSFRSAWACATIAAQLTAERSLRDVSEAQLLPLKTFYIPF